MNRILHRSLASRESEWTVPPKPSKVPSEGSRRRRAGADPHLEGLADPSLTGRPRRLLGEIGEGTEPTSTSDHERVRREEVEA